MIYQFETTPEQESAITADAKGKMIGAGEDAVQMTNEEYVMSQVIDRFLAEVTNRGTQIKKEAIFASYEKSDKKAEIDTLLNEEKI